MDWIKEKSERADTQVCETESLRWVCILELSYLEFYIYSKVLCD